MYEQRIKQGMVQTIPPSYPNAPKELTILQRLDGLTGGLGELHGNLHNFMRRLGLDQPEAAEALGNAPAPHGIEMTLSFAEQHLRECMNALTRLNDRF
jgi:hypothetical protein